MLQYVVLFYLIVGRFVSGSSEADSDFGAGLISSMIKNANSDQSVDEEYEDLRAELFAYHTALASLIDTQSRRSMLTTPCWQLGGVCVNVKLCEGYRFLTEVPGCKNRLNVCCFSWNKFRVKDYRAEGISSVMFPWSIQHKFGGKGVIHPQDKGTDKDEISNRNGKHEFEKPKKSAKSDTNQDSGMNADEINDDIDTGFTQIPEGSSITENTDRFIILEDI